MNLNSSAKSQDSTNSCGATSRPEPLCVFCKDAHYSSTCEKYATAQAHFEALPPNSCIGCLRVHTGSCPWAKKCFVCGSCKHHRAFCPEKVGYFTRPNSDTKLLKSQPEKSEPAKDKQTENQNAKKSAVTLVRQYRSTHNTARVKVINPITNKSTEMRVLFDGGLSDTYILQSRADEHVKCLSLIHI